MFTCLKRGKKGLSYRKIRNFLCIVLSVSFIASLIIPAYSGTAGKAYGRGDETASGSAFAPDAAEGFETETLADDAEDVETEITSAAEAVHSGGNDGRDRRELSASAKNKYRITVKYDDSAGIPEGAELRVSEMKPEKYLSEAADTFGWTDEDYILYTRFFDISIVKGGSEIEPRTPVTVTAELLDADEDAEVLQVVHFDEDGAEEVEISASEDAEVTFETDSFSVYGFGSALHTVMSEKSELAELAVYSFDEASTAEAAVDTDFHEEGFDTVRVFETDGGSRLWVKASLGENANLASDECLALYGIQNGGAGEVIMEDIAADDELHAVNGLVSGLALMRDTGYRHLSFELSPNEDSEVVLDGMMPKNASAEAVDVTESRSGAAAAFDITIKNGEDEYQPGENRPIFVQITDPRITADMQLWHIKDDGEREQITGFAAEEGRIVFNAAGFSVYEIVEGRETGWIKIASVDELAARSQGVYIGHTGGYYFTNTPDYDNSRKGIKKTKPASNTPSGEAAEYYFEKAEGTENQFYVYCYSGGEKQYLYNANNNSLSFTDEANKTAFTAETDNNGGSTRFRFHNGNWYWNMQGSANGTRFCSYSNATDGNNYLYLWYMEMPDLSEYDLENNRYGFMYYTGSPATTGEGLAADNTNNAHTLVELRTRSESDKTLYVDQESDITLWSFTAVGDGKYRLQTEADGITLYMRITDTGVSFTDIAEDASDITITLGSKGKMQLSAGSSCLYYDTDKKTFSVTDDKNDIRSWLNPVKTSALGDDDLIVYSAHRISSADAESGKKYIIYTRVWNEEEKGYDFYAIDHDGTLVPVYASGGKIQYLGTGESALEWEFTAYTKADGKTDNGYYELYNPYSGKYIAPQRNGQVLSDNKIGINMEGRRNGEYYTTIVAWDNYYYQYAGIKAEPYTVLNSNGVSEDRMKLASVLFTGADVFYFAALEMDDPGTLHTVDTLDNAEHGVTMRMFDFNGTNASTNDVSTNYFNNNGSNTKGLLQTRLEYETDPETGEETGAGYPVVKQNGKKFSDLYADAYEVNHLFIENIYNSSGYFEFDSCQNFATLLDAERKDGSLNTENVEVKDADGKTTTKEVKNFTVYKELGTTDEESKSTLKHGQFFPYNMIQSLIYSEHNPKNLYGMNAVFGNNSMGLLDENDPRRNEDLHKLGVYKNGEFVYDAKGQKANIDFFFGMEMSASFIQTPSGLDTWGHDIIFEFTGDDDFWFYVDGELVLDLGGIHSAEHGFVNFRTGEITLSKINGSSRNTTDTTLRAQFIQNYKARGMKQDEAEAKADEIFEYDEKTGGYTFKDYTTHTMRIFYMERGAGASNLHMRFNLSAVTPGHVVLKKELDGDDDLIKSMDISLLQYPFKIEYKTDEDGADWEDLTDATPLTGVYYQGSEDKVTFASKYRPPNCETVFENVFFMNPLKGIEIKFPDEAMFYRITECAVNTAIYEVEGAGDTQLKEIQVEGAIYDYQSQESQVLYQPSAAFVNRVKDESVKSLSITKELYDENGQKLTAEDDQTLFQYRLSIAEYEEDDSDPTGVKEVFADANTRLYYVHDPDGYLCRWEPNRKGNIKFEAAVLSNGKKYKNLGDIAAEVHADEGLTDAQKETLTNELTEELRSQIGFYTSIYGAISNIPVGYTVEVPGFITGTKFKVEERSAEIPVGYGLIKYECVMGEKHFTDGSVQKVSSYTLEEGEDGTALHNIGTVEIEHDPSMLIKNRRGCGISVNKVWTDAGLVNSHGKIYTAVYIRTNDDPATDTLLPGSVRQLSAKDGTDTTSVMYYFDSLLEGHTLDDYIVKEVVLGSEPSDENVDPYNGAVREPGTVTPVTELRVDAASESTEDGETVTETYDYIETYTKGVTGLTAGGGETRAGDTITNARKGGVVIRLFKWDSMVPLANGKFVITRDGNRIGEYTSDANGLVTALYGLEAGKTYVLTETAPPNSYEGMERTVQFRVDDKGVITYWNDNNSEGWARHTADTENIIEYIDIFNKPFTITVKKVDTEGNSLSGALFALYKQVVSKLGGAAKSADPVAGFSDMKTDGSGQIVLSSDSGERTLGPGTYYLVEQEAPVGFKQIMDELMFDISSIGRITVVGDLPEGITFTDKGEHDYLITVPNEVKPNTVVLAVEKTVRGNMGDKERQFEFTLTYTEPEQEAKTITFRLRSGERSAFAFAKNTSIVLTESNEDYDTEFKLGDREPEEGNSLTFELTESTQLEVINTRDVAMPTGIKSDTVRSAEIIAGLLALIALAVIRKKRVTQ